jgi:SprT-like protein
VPPRPDVTATARRFRVDPDCSREEFIAVAKVYAREVVDRHDLSVSVSDLEWTVSEHAKRHAGAVKHRAGNPQSVVLTWAQFAERGWSAAAATIRHELIHAHLLNETGDPSHGDRFRELARRLDTNVRCELFARPDWWVVCEGCGSRLARYRRSKLVSEPEAYACSDCAGDLRVEPTE